MVTERQGSGLYSGGREAAVLLVVLLVGGCGPSAPAVPVPADWSLVPSPAHPQIREAADHCRSHPREPAAFERLAAIYFGNEQTDLAAQCYEIALALGSRSAKAHYLLGLIRRERGASDAAIRHFREAAALEPTYGPVPFNLGLSLLDAGRAVDAVEAFRAAVRLRPADSYFYSGLARALRQAGRLDEAEAELRRALQLAPDNAEAHQLLGLTLQARGETAAALEHLNRVRRRSGRVVSDPWLLAVQRHAATAEILLARVRALMADERLDSALELLSVAVESYPNRARVHRLRGDVLLRRGQIQPALDAYGRASELDPHDPEAHAALAILLSQHGDLDAASGEAGLALAADPDHPMALIVKASVEVRRGQPTTALSTIQPLLDRRDDLAGAHVVRGEALLHLGRLDPAATAFSRAAQLEPSAAYPRRRLGAIYERLGRFEDARRERGIAKELDPGDEP